MTAPGLSILLKEPLATLLPITTEYVSLGDRKRPLSMVPASLVSLDGKMPWTESETFWLSYETAAYWLILGFTSTTPGVPMSRLTSLSVNFAGGFSETCPPSDTPMPELVVCAPGVMIIWSRSRFPNCWLKPEYRPSPRVSMTTMAMTPMMMPSDDMSVLNLLLEKSENVYSRTSSGFMVSLRPQCLYGVEPGSLVGRVYAEDDGHGKPEDDADDGVLHGHAHGKIHDVAHDEGHDLGYGDPPDAAEQAKYRRLGYEHHAHVGRRGAHGFH